MRFTHFFVDRPIFATVLSVIIVLLGGISYFGLPVAQYPEIAPPSITVSAIYPGASAETVADTVASVIEQQVNGVEGMLYMKSENTADGRMTLSVVFSTGTDLDAAQVLVQNRVTIAEPLLPEEVKRLGVDVRKNSPDLMMVIHILSPDDSRDSLYVSNYARTQVVDRLARIDGVGQAMLFAERAYAMRVWIDPERAASFDLTAGEIVAALRQNNVQVAAGRLNALPMENQGAFEFTVETQGRLLAPEEFADVVVKRGADGRTVRVGDLARVELAAQDYQIIGYLDDKVALPIGIFQRPGSNALETAAALKAEMQSIGANMPEGIGYAIVYDPTVFIDQSVRAIYTTIGEALALVVLVILVFLQSWRAALIPIVAIPISLIGTFGVMAALGLSLNNLSLFGLVLAIGIVVDDAIVVVENVERYVRRGMDAREAAHRSMDEVGGAIVAMSLVLVAVFLPTAFVAGISGAFYQQFALTIATATMISAVVSLTLSPALAALLFQRRPAAPTHGWRHALGAPGRLFARGFVRVFDGLAAFYGGVTRRLVRFAVLVLVVYAGLIGLTADRFAATPTGFIPQQDQGYLIAVLQLPPGASLTRTDEVVRRASELLRAVPGVAHTVGLAGLDGATFTNASNAGVVFLPLLPFSERIPRGLSDTVILGQAQRAIAQIDEALAFVIAPPPVRGVGTGGGWKLYLQDRAGRGVAALEQAAGEFTARANQDPNLARVFTFFNTRTPRVYADIDRTRAEMLRVPTTRVLEALEVYLGSAYVNDFNFIGRTYRVIAQADGQYRDDLADIGRYRTRSESGAMVPLGAVASFEYRTAAARLPRYNLYPAVDVQGATAPGVSTGQAIGEIEAMLDAMLPDGIGYEWTELALQEKLTGNTALLTFGLAVVFTFLLLAALYESWMLPLAVILIVPMCLLAAVVGIGLRGFDNNILVQIGFVVLVGLAAKNAILIVEFARQGEARGLDRAAAAVEAARTRLRPILMTSFAFILGVLPLVLATGAGAEMRQSLGTAVFAGMLGVTLFGLLFTPVFYVVCRWLSSLFARRDRASPATD